FGPHARRIDGRPRSRRHRRPHSPGLCSEIWPDRGRCSHHPRFYPRGLIMPFLALALGLATTILIVRAWSKRPAPAAAGAVLPVTGPELDRFRKKAQEDTEI